jgi:hypothetical protein
MKIVFVVLSVLFAGSAHAGTVVCTTNGNVTTCVEQPSWNDCAYTKRGCF